MTSQPDGNPTSSEHQEMPLIEHLLELRNRPLNLVLTAVICFAAS